MRPLSRRGLLEAIALVPTLAFVFLMGYAAHLDVFREAREETGLGVLDLAAYSWDVATGARPDYPYPLHVDENLHWAMAANIQRSEQLFVAYPVGTIESDDHIYSLRGAVHERGFQLVIAEAQAITGVPFHVLFRFLPSLWLAFTAFGVYAMLRPHQAALPAAAFVGLIPTSVRFLGPSFLVPIGFVLAWLPAVILLSQPAHRRLSSAFLLLAVTGWTFFIHLIGGFAAVGMLALAALFTLREERRSALLLMLFSAIPVIWLYRAFEAGVRGELTKEEGLPIDFTIFDGFGLHALIAWMLALPLFVYRERRVARLPLGVFAWASVLSLGLIIVSVAFDLNRYATYARWHPVFFLTASVPLGYLVSEVAGTAYRLLSQLTQPARWWGPVRKVATGLSAFAVALVIATPGVEGHLREQYYHVIDDRDWSRFVWVQENVGPEYEVFLMHPWKAPVLSAMTGKEPYTFLAPGAPPVRGEAYDEFAANGGTAEFFILNDVTFVISTGKPPHDFFVPLGPDVWGMEPDLVRQIAAIRAAERADAG